MPRSGSTLYRMRSRINLHSSVSFRTAMQALKKRDTGTAVETLRSLVDSCPVNSRSCLSRGRRDGNKGPSLRSLASAQRLCKRGHARSLYLRLSNGFGMPKLASPYEDDRAAFYSVQISRYLERRPKRAFASECERDMVYSLVGDSWKALWRSGVLSGLSDGRKLAYFRAARIVFPMRGPERAFEGADISVDFSTGTRTRSLDACPCGSGLPFLRCCGRPATLGEAERGFF
jgi:hypothetical protein